MKPIAGLAGFIITVLLISGCAGTNPILRGAKIDYQHERYDIAITKIHKSLELNPVDGDAYYYLGACYVRTRQYDEAFASFMRAAALDTALVVDVEKEIEVKWIKLFNDGVNYLNDKRFEKALTDLLNATHIDPRRVDNYNALSNVYNLTDDPDNAYLCSMRAIEIDPGNEPALDNLGVYHYNRNEFPEGIVFFERIIEASPDNKRALELTADSYLKVEDFDKAREKYNALMLLEPEAAEHLVNASALEIVAEEWGNAKDICLTGILIFPGNADIIVNYVMACKELGVVEEALATIEEAMQMNPDNPDILIAYASVLYDLEKYNTVIKVLEDSGITFGEGTEEGLRLLGLSYIEKKKYFLAIGYLEDLAVYYPDDKDVYTLLARSYFKIGENTMANFYFEEAKRLEGAGVEIE